MKNILYVIVLVSLTTIVKSQTLGSSVERVDSYISPLGYQKLMEKDVNEQGFVLKAVVYKKSKSDGVTIKQFVFRTGKLLVKATATTGTQEQATALASSYSTVDGKNLYIDTNEIYHYINVGQKAGMPFVIHLESRDKFFLQNFAPSFYQGFNE